MTGKQSHSDTRFDALQVSVGSKK